MSNSIVPASYVVTTSLKLITVHHSVGYSITRSLEFFFSKTHRATVISSMSICPLQRPFCNRQSSQSPLREFYSKDSFSTIFKVAVSLLTNCIFQKACPIVWELTYLLLSSLFPVESCSAPFLVLLEA